MKTDYRTVIQLAEAKGYKPEFYISLEQIEVNSQFANHYPDEGRYLTLCHIQKWLRDEHDVQVLVMPNGSKEKGDMRYTAILPMCYLPKNEAALKRKFEGGKYNPSTSYEDALLNGIYEALNLIQ